MKKNWKIIVGVILIVGGIGLAATDLFSGAIDIAVGIVLVVWWKLGRKRPSNRSPRSVAPPPPAVRAKQGVAKQAAPPTPAPVPAQNTNQATILTKKPPVSPSVSTTIPELQKPVMSSGDIQKPAAAKRPNFPYKKDGAPEAYRYRIVFAPFSSDVVVKAIQEERWYLTARMESGEIHLFLDEIDLGILPERADMMKDWLKRGDPYMIAIEEDKNNTGFVITLVFYKDKQKYNAHREQTVIALTGYKSEKKQDAISFLEEGEELEAEEDPENEDRVYIVSRLGDLVGNLPKKYAQKFLDEGAALIVFDHEEPVEDSDISKPFVKIYW